MPSPFPGMDPYLEAPDIWPDFHDALASEIRVELNRGLPAPYYARLEMRPEVGIIEDGGGRLRIIPDVAVVRHPGPPARVGGVAVMGRARRAIAEAIEVEVHADPIRHHYIEIRDPSRGHKLITLIEILSPSNKRRGPDREAYERKQRELLESDASLLELDLLRAGDRILPAVDLRAIVAELNPPADYLILLSRAWRRGGHAGFSLFPFSIREMLPCVPVPLREGEPEMPLDLQLLAERAYDGGPYHRGAVDYSQPPSPPLKEADAAWGAGLVRAWAGEGEGR